MANYNTNKQRKHCKNLIKTPLKRHTNNNSICIFLKKEKSLTTEILATTGMSQMWWKYSHKIHKNIWVTTCITKIFGLHCITKIFGLHCISKRRSHEVKHAARLRPVTKQEVLRLQPTIRSGFHSGRCIPCHSDQTSRDSISSSTASLPDIVAMS